MIALRLVPLLVPLALGSGCTSFAKLDYGDLLTGLVLDEQDAHLDGTLGTPTIVAQTVMVTLQDRVVLGRTAVDFIETLS